MPETKVESVSVAASQPKTTGESHGIGGVDLSSVGVDVPGVGISKVSSRRERTPK